MIAAALEKDMQVSASGREHPRTTAHITKNVDFWRRCAKVARKVAHALNDGPAITRTLEIGRQCDRLAREVKEGRRETH
jgi:hypothetical protein